MLDIQQHAMQGMYATPCMRAVLLILRFLDVAIVVTALLL